MTEAAKAQVSVIVPIYNVGPYLARCLDSLLNQTLKEIEIICVDDGSTDHGPEILAEYAARDSRIVVFRQSNQGVAAARNQGLALARAPYIGFVDPDDWIEAETYKSAWEIMFRDDEIDLAVWNAVITETDGRPRKTKADKSHCPAGGKQIYDANSPLRRVPHIHCGLFRADLLKKHGVNFPPYSIGEDDAFYWKYSAHVRFVYYLPDAFYHYCWRDGSLTCLAREDKPDARYDHIALLNDVLDHYHRHGLWPENKAHLTAVFLRHYHLGRRLSIDPEKFHNQARTLVKALGLPNLPGRIAQRLKKEYQPPERGNYTWLEQIFSVKNVCGRKILCLVGLRISLWRKPGKGFR